VDVKEERGNGGRSTRVEEKGSEFVRACEDGGVCRHGGGGARARRRVGGGGIVVAWSCRWSCCIGGEGVVVAPLWWMGGQPPPKIKFLNFFKVGFFFLQQFFLNRRSWVQTPSPILNLLETLEFLGKGEGRELKFKAQGLPITCLGLPIQQITHNLKV
jgi:hypothetical protein